MRLVIRVTDGVFQTGIVMLTVELGLGSGLCRD